MVPLVLHGSVCLFAVHRQLTLTKFEDGPSFTAGWLGPRRPALQICNCTASVLLQVEVVQCHGAPWMRSSLLLIPRMNECPKPHLIHHDGWLLCEIRQSSNPRNQQIISGLQHIPGDQWKSCMYQRFEANKIFFSLGKDWNDNV